MKEDVQVFHKEILKSEFFEQNANETVDGFVVDFLKVVQESESTYYSLLVLLLLVKLLSEVVEMPGFGSSPTVLQQLLSALLQVASNQGLGGVHCLIVHLSHEGNIGHQISHVGVEVVSHGQLLLQGTKDVDFLY